MATQNSGINLFDQDPQDSGKRDGKRTAFALGALVALGVAGALGVGFVLGGGNANDGSVKGDTSEPTRVVRVSPTASNPQAGGQTQPPSGNTQPGGSDSGSSGAGDTGSSSGSGASDTGSGGEPPAPTNTPEPPAPTDTPVPPTETPTDTPTSTPTATSTPSGDPCPWCPDLDLVDPGIVFDPGLVIIDIFPPAFDYANSMNCAWGTMVGASVNENAEMWVTYTILGLFDAESEHVYDVNVAMFNIGGGPFVFPAEGIVVHARDAMGNESTRPADWMPCL